MHTVNTIVLALDGSDAAKRAIPFAVGLARERGSEIVIVHVDERMGTRGPGTHRYRGGEDPGGDSDAGQELAAQGIEARLEIVEMVSRGAEIARAIADIAERSKADLIVTGTRGHSEMAGLFVGSVTQRLLHVATQPVLTVPDLDQPQRQMASCSGVAGISRQMAPLL